MNGHVFARWLSVLTVVAVSVSIDAANRPIAQRRAGAAAMPNAAELTTLVQGVQALQEDLPRDSFDPQVIADQLGREPARIVDWMRVNTKWVPYRGALRGPVGVLLDRMGNSVDRALLLAELLRDADRTVRLARAKLSNERARVLADANRMDASSSATSEPSDLTIDEARIAEVFQLDAQDVRQRATASAARASQITTDVAARVGAQAPFLIDAADKPTSAEDEAGTELAAAADHWWVQIEEDGRWIDYDIMAAPGTVKTVPDEVFPYDQPAPAIPLPDDFAQTITIRVVIEQSTATGAVRKTPLEYRFRPSELQDPIVHFEHAPLTWPSQASLLDSSNPAREIEDAASAQKEWVPVLKIGGRAIVQSSISEAGNVGRPGQTRDDSSGAANGCLTSEWIEFDIRVPGQRDRVIRRDLFAFANPLAGNPARVDLPPAARMQRGLRLLSRIDILPVTSRWSRPYILNATFADVLQNEDAVRSVTERLEAGNASAALSQAEMIKPGNGLLLNLAAERFAESWVAADVFVDSPNILAYRWHPVDDGRGNIGVQAGFDIVANAVAVKRTSVLLPFYARLIQGITDTNVEAAIGDRPVAGNAGLLLGNAPVTSEWMTLRRQADMAPASVRWPADFGAQIDRALRDGRIVIAPRKAEAGAAFWSIDPATGETVGIGALGWGQAMVEYVVPTVGVYGAWVGLCVHAVWTSGGSARLLPARIAGCTLTAGLSGLADALLSNRQPPLPPPPASMPNGRRCGSRRSMCR